MDYQPQFDQPQEPQKSWFSAHMILGVVFLLASGAAIVTGMYYWQTVKSLPQTVDFPVHKDPTAGWKIYNNSEYGFEFKYPSDWAITDFSNSDPNPNTKINSVGVTKEETDNDYLRFEVSSSKTNLELGIGSSYPIGDEITAGGVKWQMVQFNDGVPGEDNVHYSAHLSTEHEGKFYSMTLYPSDNFNIPPIFNQILSTFKFIEPEVCIQVITPARNPQTGEEKAFPTPCDVPEGWEKVDQM